MGTKNGAVLTFLYVQTRSMCAAVIWSISQSHITRGQTWLAVIMAILIMVKLLRVQSCENPSIDDLGLCLLVHTCGIIVQDEYISFSYFRFVPSHNGRSMCAISLAPLTKSNWAHQFLGLFQWLLGPSQRKSASNSKESHGVLVFERNGVLLWSIALSMVWLRKRPFR